MIIITPKTHITNTTYRISGSEAITKLFEGEPDHLVPSVSDELLDNDMFTVAGRMIGHSFLQGGPSFPGLSPAIIHILFGGSLETSPVTIRDCPDLDIRDTMKMLDGDAELNESIHHLCLSWDLPAPKATNRKWLSEKLLLHAVTSKCSQANKASNPSVAKRLKRDRCLASSHSKERCNPNPVSQGIRSPNPTSRITAKGTFHSNPASRKGSFES
ncbi:hypothetical protein L3Q82_016107 [Scortum barcoo]|uniref:Uncharacterized protein n=1 Tax=Scortum barcoo TaxID=214431 RepID=A0ACB8VPU1_9TELE|nr:hypothetical protein L3Q82_016107 [Scortum barcoo]